MKQLAFAPRASNVKSGRWAVRELLHSSPTAYAAAAPDVVARYSSDKLSVPEVGSHPPSLRALLDPVGAATLDNFVSTMLNSDYDMGMHFESGSSFQPYMDRTLQQDAREYCRFIARLYRAGMITFTQSPKDIVTPFFVPKKDGRIRLVLDCRGPNLRFKKCPKLRVAGGYKWGEARLPPNSDLYVAQSDVKFFSTL